MLFGNFEYQLDDKGRFSVPSKLRGELGTNVFLLKGFDGCLSIYTEADFIQYTQKLKDLPFEKEKARLHQRILLGSVEMLSIDKQGRLQIPAKTIKKYQISKNIVILGLMDHIEIWSKEAYEDYIVKNEKEFETNAEDLLKNEIWFPWISP